MCLVCFVFRRLVDVVKTSKDDTALAVACYDLGEFARFHPDGKKVISASEGKTALMMKMQYKENANVARQALLAVQKLMVSNWEFLSGSKKDASSSSSSS